MRRCLHSLLVGLLVFSQSIDAARACEQFLDSEPCPPPVVEVVITVIDECDPCGAADIVADDCCDEAVIVPECVDALPCCGEVVLGDSVTAADMPLVEPAGFTEIIGVPAPEPVPTPAAADSAPTAPEPVTAVPALEPTESSESPAASGIGEPVHPNVFEEADAAVPEGAAAPTATPRAEREPLRRWIDATASYAVAGRLVDVREEGVEILKADGRSVTVPLDRLSDCDRGYVTAVTPRIVAARGRGPLPTDTAGR